MATPLLLSTACATTGDSDELDGVDEAALGGGKADLSAWSGAELAGAARAANALTLGELDHDAALATRAAKAIVAHRPIRGIVALDAVPYVGPVALDRLVAYADDRGWTSGDMVPVPAVPRLWRNLAPSSKADDMGAAAPPAVAAVGAHRPSRPRRPSTWAGCDVATSPVRRATVPTRA